MKLVIEEQESPTLAAHVDAAELATSRIAVVEVLRACRLASPAPEVEAAAERLLSSCALVEVTERILRTAAEQTSAAVRTLDAIHLASALRVDPDEVVVYDRRLAAAAAARGLAIAQPGAAS